MNLLYEFSVALKMLRKHVYGRLLAKIPIKYPIWQSLKVLTIVIFDEIRQKEPFYKLIASVPGIKNEISNVRLLENRRFTAGFWLLRNCGRDKASTMISL